MKSEFWSCPNALSIVYRDAMRVDGITHRMSTAFKRRNRLLLEWHRDKNVIIKDMSYC